MNRGFIRVLWGVSQIDRWHRHRAWINDQITFLKMNPYPLPFTAFVFGSENFKQLVDLGFNCKLIDERPCVWNMATQQFRHKLEALKFGMQEFDEMVFLDWDTQLTKPLPIIFWESLNEKESLQVSLRAYRRHKITWRVEDGRYVPCAAFIYIRDKNIPNELIKTWEDMGRPWSEEMVLTKYIENKMGGWKGVDYYLKKFEPPFFNLNDSEISIKEINKDICFHHFTRRHINKTLKKKGIKSEEKKLQETIPPEEAKRLKIKKEELRTERMEKRIRKRERKMKKLREQINSKNGLDKIENKNIDNNDYGLTNVLIDPMGI